MNINQENINPFLNKYIPLIDSICKEYHYNSNIKHLLYFIIPGFIVKYGTSNESAILECFKKVKIYINDTHDKFITASFNRTLRKDSNGYYTDKYVVIKNYEGVSLPNLIDNIVHEYNHAVNSLNNEISYDDKYIRVRTGLSTLIYDKATMKFLEKSKEISLEEVLNTTQTEEIIDIINSFGKFNIDNIEFSNMLYALKNEINGSKYTSEAYQYQKYICDELIKNKTFTPTISNLRFKGFIEDIPRLFDDVMGEDGKYKELNKLLTEIHTLVIKYSKATLFKNRLLNKIRSKSHDVLALIKEYDSKCIFK